MNLAFKTKANRTAKSKPRVENYTWGHSYYNELNIELRYCYFSNTHVAL